MATTLAVLTDTHFSATPNAAKPERRGERADTLIDAALRRMRRLSPAPDATLFLGDALDDGEAPDARRLLERLREALEDAPRPLVAIPGNHDGPPERFFEVFGRPPEWLDLHGGTRLTPFVDAEAPDFNAWRTEADIARLARARTGFDGEIVAVQHVPLFPPGALECPYNYTNAQDIVAAAREADVRLCVGGHYHRGAGPLRYGRQTYFVAPALCQTPFPLHLITLDAGRPPHFERLELGAGAAAAGPPLIPESSEEP